MKKIILTGFIILAFSIFSVSFVYATPKEVSCGEMKRLWDGGGECEFPIYKIETNSLWCGSSYEYVSHINDYEPSYKLPPGVVCPGLSNGSKNESKEEKQPQDNQIEEQFTSGTNIFQIISENFQDFYLTKAEFTKADTDILVNFYERAPRLTEENIKISQKEWEHTPTPDTNKTTSPYRLDILNGAVQIKLPGQNEWSDLKQGDRIPPGSTIFTGMDATTVLSIQDKGVVQVLPFTEVTITEEGLADPTKTTTDINLRTGEIELNIEGGLYSPSFQVFTTNAVAGVKGTHFWVSYNKEKKLSTVGVYKGEVEVKTRGSDKSSLVSPNGDRPGVIVVTQKLSMIKIATSLVVVLTAIVAIFRFLKRRGKKVSARRR